MKDSSAARKLPDGVTIEATAGDGFDDILTFEALDLVASLHREFAPRVAQVLQARREREAELLAGAPLSFLDSTRAVREDATWRVAGAAPGLFDRRVEITGPTERKMTINALNSGAKVWLADFEDANAPIFENMVVGQRNLRDVLDRCIDFTDEATGKRYELKPREELATIVVRPRGWHLVEKHLFVDGQPTVAALFDFGLYMFHSAARQLETGLGPYFYLPKLESHLEARLWNDVFVSAQEALGIPRGTIRATVLVETYPAAFEMDEILYELREHAAGLNAGRWDYLFSVIKKLRTRGADFLLPDRNTVTMTAPFMRAYTRLLVHTCHKRGAHAIGGMAAFIPNRKDPEINEVALARVRADKEREAGDGFDGSWVAHPDLVPVCREEFDKVLGDRPNQLEKLGDGDVVTADDLLDVKSTPGGMTEAGLRNNVSVSLQYMAAWLRGNGAVAIFNLMEDAATAEICRSQVWQWLHNDVKLEDGPLVTRELVERIIDEELAAVRATLGEDAFAAGAYDEARELFTSLVFVDDFVEFLTLPAYERLP